MPKLIQTTAERPDASIDAVVASVTEKAIAKFEQQYAQESDGLYPTGTQIGRGSLRPWHVGLDSAALATRGRWQFTPAAAGWANWIDITVYRYTFLVVEGIGNPDPPNVYELRPNFGGMDYPVVNITEIYDYEETLGWFEVPYPIAPNQTLTYRINWRNANQVERIYLLGEAVAYASYLRDETPPTE